MLWLAYHQKCPNFVRYYIGRSSLHTDSQTLAQRSRFERLCNRNQLYTPTPLAKIYLPQTNPIKTKTLTRRVRLETAGYSAFLSDE